MEIVSYVGFNENSSIFEEAEKFISSLLRKHKPGQKRDPIIKEKAAKSVRKPVRQKVSSADSSVCVSFTDILRSTGSAVSYVQENSRRIGMIAGAVCGVFVLASTSILAYRYFQNTASPVVFADSYESEMQMLDKLMNSFALEETSEYSDDGTIVGSAPVVNMEKLFRQPVTFQTYKVQAGDTISGITKKFGLSNISTLIAVNDIDNVRQLCAGQKLRIPSMDGLYYTVQRGNSLQGLSSKFGVTLEDILDVNELESSELAVGQVLFIPGAKLDMSKLQQAMGELFKNPISAKYRLTSRFGPRADPFTGARSSHTGIDMACAMGTPIVATASGKVTYSGVSPVYGNYVIINHGNGYQSLYGHMSMIIAKKGQWVSQGTRIGLVGSTGYSTGPHLHFTVFKNGKLVDPLTLIK